MKMAVMSPEADDILLAAGPVEEAIGMTYGRI